MTKLKYERTILLRVDEVQLQRVMQMAEAWGRSKQSVIRSLIDTGFSSMRHQHSVGDLREAFSRALHQAVDEKDHDDNKD